MSTRRSAKNASNVSEAQLPGSACQKRCLSSLSPVNERFSTNSGQYSDGGRSEMRLFVTQSVGAS